MLLLCALIFSYFSFCRQFNFPRLYSPLKMGRERGWEEGRSSRYSDDLTVFSLFLFLSMRVCAYISERERERETTKRDREREEIDARANFYLDFCPADSLKIYFVALASFASFAFVFFFFFFLFFSSTPSLPSSSKKEHTRKEERRRRRTFDFLFSLCEIKPFVSSSVHYYYEYEYGYKILLQQC